MLLSSLNLKQTSLVDKFALKKPTASFTEKALEHSAEDATL